MEKKFIPEVKSNLRHRMVHIPEAMYKASGITVLGKRKLAYEINYIKEGYYYIVNFDLDPQFVKEIERRCRLFDQIIRYMVVRVDEQ